MSFDLTRIFWRWIRLTSPPSCPQRTFQRLRVRANRITWSARVLHPAFLKSRCGRSRGWLEAPSCVLLCNRPASSNVLGVSLVVSDASSTKMNFCLIISNLWRLGQHKIGSTVLNDELLWCPCHMPASLSISTVISSSLLSLQRLEPDWLVLFHRIDWIESTNALWRLFSFLFRDSTKEPAFFTLNPSRIALIITIRGIATIKNPFRCFYRCSDSFQHLNFLPILKNPSSAPACCSKPNHRQLAGESLEERRDIFDERHSVFQLYRLVSLFFDILHSLML